MNIDANVQKIIFALLRKWKLIVVFAIIGAMLGYFYTTNFTTLTYTSNVEFLAYAVDSDQEVGDEGQSTTSNDYVRTSNTSKMNYAMKMLDTYIEVMNTNKFHEKVASDLNERIGASYSSAFIKSAITITSVQNTAMFKIVVTTTDKNASYEIAHQLEDSVPEMMKTTNNGLVGVSVEDKAIMATSAESLGYAKKMLIAAIAGAVIAAVYVILRNLLDIRIKSGEELVEKYNIPVLGSIPAFDVKASQVKNTSKEAE